jgi:hypothetical protein
MKVDNAVALRTIWGGQKVLAPSKSLIICFAREKITIRTIRISGTLIVSIAVVDTSYMMTFDLAHD